MPISRLRLDSGQIPGTSRAQPRKNPSRGTMASSNRIPSGQRPIMRETRDRSRRGLRNGTTSLTSPLELSSTDVMWDPRAWWPSPAMVRLRASPARASMRPGAPVDPHRLRRSDVAPRRRRSPASTAPGRNRDAAIAAPEAANSRHRGQNPASVPIARSALETRPAHRFLEGSLSCRERYAEYRQIAIHNESFLRYATYYG